MVAINWKMPFDVELAQSRFMERGPGLLSAVFAVLIAVQLAGLTWNMVPAPALEPAPADPTELKKRQMMKQTGKRPPSLVGQDIAKLHLFETVPVAPEPAQDIPEEVKRTPLNLKLRGVLASTVEDDSLAVIEHKGRADYYAIKDPVPGNATLVKVHRDRVIIERNGEYESLMMPEEEGVPLQPVAQREASPPPTPSSMRRINTAKTRRLLKQYKKTLQTNPQSLMSLVRASPVSRGGKLTGYRIRPGRNPGLFKDFDLQAGDVVTGINGVPLNDPFKALEIVRDLRNAREVCADILRDGVSYSQCYNIGQ